MPDENNANSLNSQDPDASLSLDVNEVSGRQTGADQVRWDSQPASETAHGRVDADATQSSSSTGKAHAYTVSCLSAAWKDVKSSPKWVSRILLLGLVNIIPILNFYVYGYAMRWSRQLIFGKNTPIPEKVFGNRMFVNGFFAFVIGLACGIVVLIINSVLAFIPVIGWIIAIILPFAAYILANIMIMRSAVADSFTPGFHLGRIWNAIKSDPASLIVSGLVPSLIGAAVILLLSCIVVFAAFIAFGISGFLAASGTAGGFFGSIVILITMVPAALLFYVLECFMTAFVNVLTLRAMGHYVARNATGWVNETDISATANLHMDDF